MALDITSAAEYQSLLNQINLWYGSDAQTVIDIANQYGLTPEQIASDYLSGSGFEPWYTGGGSVGGYSSVGNINLNTATAAQAAANSNAGNSAITTLKTPVETTVAAGGTVQTSKGLTAVATGAKSPLTFITKEVMPAVAAAGLGVTLGKAIDSALYNANPDFWDNAGMSSLNPETWNSITADYPDGFLKRAFNAIYGLDPDTGETQLYIDQRAAAYLAQYMQEQGVFARGQTIHTIPAGQSAGQGTETGALISYPLEFSQVLRPDVPSQLFTSAVGTLNNSYGTCTVHYRSSVGALSAMATRVDEAVILAFREAHSSGLGIGVFSPTGTPAGGGTIAGTRSYTYNGQTVHYVVVSQTMSGWALDASTPSTNTQSVAWLSLYGNYTSSGGETIEGITDQDDATQPDFSGCSTPEDYIAVLQNTYPDMFNDAVTQSVVQPDGTTDVVTYLPIGTPTTGNNTTPDTSGGQSGSTQGNQSVDPNNINLPDLQELLNQLTQPQPQPSSSEPTDTQNPDPTGSGTTPAVIAPTGSASALWSVYNPSQAQLNSFGAWLWSSNFIDQILKLFNNPMQSIIGIHKIFAAPAISGTGSIVVGYLDSGVASNIVGAQYTTVDCGSVTVREQFGNVFDYNDTFIRLYLPFIGIVQLDTMDVMRGTVSVVYHVDVITGACLAEVKVTRDGGGGTLYQFSGDAAVRYPISSGSYMGVVSGVLGVVGGIASSIMTGGATIPMAAGAIASGMANAKTQVQHSGSFAGNAGAMGIKKPYLIIERPQTAIADGYEAYQGRGANVVKSVGDMTGYFKLTDVRTDSITGASDAEIAAIKSALERGVIK